MKGAKKIKVISGRLGNISRVITYNRILSGKPI